MNLSQYDRIRECAQGESLATNHHTGGGYLMGRYGAGPAQETESVAKVPSRLSGARNRATRSQQLTPLTYTGSYTYTEFAQKKTVKSIG